jgi:hypothetical protein
MSCDGKHPGRTARRGPYTEEQCRLCWLRLNEPAFGAAGDAPGGSGNLGLPGQSRSLPCLYLGEVVDRLGCPCPGKWVRGCALHRVCTLEVCKACRDYEAAQ